MKENIEVNGSIQCLHCNQLDKSGTLFFCDPFNGLTEIVGQLAELAQNHHIITHTKEDQPGHDRFHLFVDFEDRPLMIYAHSESAYIMEEVNFISRD